MSMHSKNTRIIMPQTKNEAESVLKQLSDFAHNLSYRNHFEKATCILYGNYLEVKTDMNKRMLFSCSACNKEMNNNKALSDHCLSGPHLKNVDKICQKKVRLQPMPKRHFPKYSLESMISSSDCKVIGLQLIESYKSSKGNLYYKCLLCGAHGKSEPMYNHFLGVKHTDAYIRARVELINPTIITPKEREYLRKEIFEKDWYGFDCIKYYEGDEFYPFAWEREATPSRVVEDRAQKRIKKELESPIPRRMSDDYKYSPSASNHRSLVTDRLSLSVGPMDHEQKKKFYRDYLENIMMKLNFIVCLNNKSPSDLKFHTREDVIAGFKIMYYVMLLLFKTQKQCLQSATGRQKAHLEEQKACIESCFGYMKERIQDILMREFEMEQVI